MGKNADNADAPFGRSNASLSPGGELLPQTLWRCFFPLYLILATTKRLRVARAEGSKLKHDRRACGCSSPSGESDALLRRRRVCVVCVLPSGVRRYCRYQYKIRKKKRELFPSKIFRHNKVWTFNPMYQSRTANRHSVAREPLCHSIK